MTRGRRPINAIDEAVEIAARRGCVEQVTGKRAGAFDLIIIGPDRNVFVKVRRSRAPFTYALEVMNSYQREIACLLRVPLTNWTAREFWVRSPKGTWQFFLIKEDSVLENRADRLNILPESLQPATADLPGTAAVSTDSPVSPLENGE
jgi:hypothetical protein